MSEVSDVGQKASVLITDLDNTLFDWVDIWHASFEAMLSEISKISGISIDALKHFAFNLMHIRQP